MVWRRRESPVEFRRLQIGSAVSQVFVGSHLEINGVRRIWRLLNISLGLVWNGDGVGSLGLAFGCMFLLFDLVWWNFNLSLQESTFCLTNEVKNFEFLLCIYAMQHSVNFYNHIVSLLIKMHSIVARYYVK